MRKFLALSVALAVTGCGDDDDNGPSLTGRIFGQTFNPAEVVFAGPTQSTSCAFPGFPVTYGIGGALIAFSPREGACALADPCQGRKDFTFVGGLIAHVAVSASTAAPSLDAGTYSVYGSVDEAVAAIATGFTGGPIRTSLLAAERTDAACVAGAPPSASGTLRIDSVTASEIRGEIDVTFVDGQDGFLRGPFTAAVCPGVTFSPCLSEAGFECTGTPTCQ